MPEIIFQLLDFMLRPVQILSMNADSHLGNQIIIFKTQAYLIIDIVISTEITSFPGEYMDVDVLERERERDQTHMNNFHGLYQPSLKQAHVI